MPVRVLCTGTSQGIIGVFIYMPQTRLLAVLCTAVLLLAACASGNVRLKNMTASEVTRLIVDNETSLFDVVSRLGEPNKNVVDKDGVQTFEFYWVKSSPSPLVILPFNFVPEFPTTKKTLRIWVDANGIITRHELSGVYYVIRRPYIGSDSAHSFRVLSQEELDDLVDPTQTSAQETPGQSAAPMQTLTAEPAAVSAPEPKADAAYDAAGATNATPSTDHADAPPALRIQ